MKPFKIFILSALALGAIACTQESVNNGESGLTPVKITAGVFTRADGAYWTADQIGVFVTAPDDMAEEYQNVGYVTESTSTTASFTAIDEDIYLTADGAAFTAYAPYQSGLSGDVISGNTANQSDCTALDYLYAGEATASISEPVVNFTFSHKMSQLIVNFVSTTEDAVDLVKAGTYTIGGLLHEGTFDVFTGETAVSGTTAEMALNSNCPSTKVTGDYEGIAYQMLLFPQTADVYFAGTVNGEEFTTTAVSQTLLAGYSYNCTLEVTVDETTGEVTVTVEGSTINDWEYGDWNVAEDEPGAEEPTSIDLSNPSTGATVETDGYTYDGTTLTVGVNATITGGTSSSPYGGEIKINSSVTEVELNGVYIDWNESNDPTSKSAAFTVSSNLTLTLTGNNTIMMKLSDVNDHDCILVNGGTLTIKGDGSLSLGESVTQNRGGALMIDNSANLVIDSGTITATSTYHCPGIGAGQAATGGDITITGGTIVATGGGQAVGIGAGYTGKCGKITISGGNVTALVSGNGGGIGAGDDATCGDIIISGGTVSATCTAGTNCTAIGTAKVSGSNSTCGDIYITDAVTSVAATGSGSASYCIGLGAGTETCGTVYLGGSSVADQSVTSWTPGSKLTLDTNYQIYGWTLTDGTWTKDGN